MANFRWGLRPSTPSSTGAYLRYQGGHTQPPSREGDQVVFGLNFPPRVSLAQRHLI
jgi:hypothetical protein